jgi:hypothetical protein
MSHPGNDEIIDNAIDNKVELSQSFVLEMTKFGIGIVQEIAKETLKLKPGMSTKEFVKVLDKYLKDQENMVNSFISK